MCISRVSLTSVVLAAALLLLPACSDDHPVAPRPVGSLPETLARAERLFEDAEGIHYRGLLVQPAADVVAVEWRLEAVPASQSGVILHKEAEWHRAEGTEFEFVVPTPTHEQGQWVLFVRSISAQGSVDQSPMELSFGAESVAPSVRWSEQITFFTGTCVISNTVVDISWSVSDPDSTAGPLVARYVVLNVGGADDPCLTTSIYSRDQPIAQLDPHDPRWSEWRLYDPAADSWDPARSERLDGFAIDHAYLVAVQARDATGATSSSFLWNQNVLHVRVAGENSPNLTVESERLGTDTVRGTADLLYVSTIDLAPLQFSWKGDAFDYAGRVVDYRWGWDLVDPGDPNDPGWSGPWSDETSSNERASDAGPHNFVVQCRDNSGSISRAVIEIESVGVPPRAAQRDLLLVDDWHDVGDEAEAREAVWDRQWEDWLTQIVPDFDAGMDVIDAQRAPGELSLERLVQYKGIVWFTNSSERSYLHGVYAARARESRRTHDLQMLQRSCANLLLVGPGSSYGSIPRSIASSHYDSFPVWFVEGPYPYSGPIPGDSSAGNEWLWPASGFCVRTLSFVRPAAARIQGELPGQRLRTTACDGLARAALSPALQGELDTTGLRELRPDAARLEAEFGLALGFEEFYDRNASEFDMDVLSRDCVVPMFEFRSRFAEGLAEESECGEKLNSLDGAAVGVLSRAYTDTRRNPGTYDFLWGFNPMGFEADDIEAALGWVVREGWQIR